MRALLFTIIFGLISTIVFTQTDVVNYQTTNVYIEKGNYYYDQKDYKKAIVYYNMSLKKDKNYYSILRKAEAYTKMELYDQAIECYRIFFKPDLQVSNDNRLKYAFVLLKNKNIKGFERWIKEYNASVESEAYSKDLYKDTTFVIVENEGILNTPESEMYPVIYQDKVVFASTRKNLDGTKSNNHYNTFLARYSKYGRLGKLNIFNKSLNSRNNNAAICFSDQTNKMFVTRNTSSDRTLTTYTTNIPENNSDKLDLTEFTIDGFNNIGHICFNSNGTKIYFVADAPGGLGGLDIYSADLMNGAWSKPVNMGGIINSPNDEMYPFVLSDTILYFSSNKSGGLGGFDLYSISLTQKMTPEKNLGNKVNSRYDDYGLTFSNDGITGYFASNRPGGFGKEDIYRLHLLDLKIKYEAFQFKKTYSIQDHKINLYMSDGGEYNIASDDGSGFYLGFHPQEPYKMVIRHENPLANNIINNDKLNEEQKEKEFLYPKPFEQTVIDLQPGLKYMFTAGIKPISEEHKKELDEIKKEYEGSGGSTIDLTILAKELLLKENEVFTIHFVNDSKTPPSDKNKEFTSIALNHQNVDVSGKSFFIVLPLDIQANFNIETDISYFKENYNPRKTGPIKIDDTPVIKEKIAKNAAGFPILVNTESKSDAGKIIQAKELAIIPGSLYNFTLTKYFTGTTEKLEIFVPMTKGVKYNLGKETMSQNEFNQTLSKMKTREQRADYDAELIDISVLSKELDISPDDSVLFTLIPVKRFSNEANSPKNVITTLDVDGRKYFITQNQKMQIKLKLEQAGKMNLQTDLKYIEENFEASTITLIVDNESLMKDLAEMERHIITDPVFDVIVVNFDLSKFDIRPDAKNILDEKVVKELKNNDQLYVTIKGYTDPLGDAEYNKKLSENRAQAVKDYLSANGIGEDRIRTFSFGETLSLEKGQNWEDLSETELQKHRKVEIKMYMPR